MLMEAMEKEPSTGPEGTTTGIGTGDIQSGDWLVVMYDQNWWLAKALTIDPEHQIFVFSKNKDGGMSALCHLQIF